MGDKGFTMHHLSYLLGIGMVLPPKRKRGATLFTHDQCVLTSKVANKRIHVERAMKRIKAFSYLARTIPFDQFDILSHIVFVIAFLSNFQPPLRDTELHDDRDEDVDGDDGDSDVDFTTEDGVRGGPAPASDGSDDDNDGDDDADQSDGDADDERVD